MSYRDDDEALRARADALQEEVRALREENETLKNPPPMPAPKPKEPTLEEAEQASLKKQQERSKQHGRTASIRDEHQRLNLILLQLFGVPLLLALAFGPIVALGRDDPSMPLGFFGVMGVLLGGVTAPTALGRVLFPSVPIMGRSNELGGGLEAVDRPMKTRKWILQIALAVYLVGAVLLFSGTK